MSLSLNRLFAALLALSCSLSFAQLKSPDEFLGYELGSRFTRHHAMHDYLRHVVSEVPHLELQQYGESYEHRPLLLLYISSKANMENLEQIRKNNLARVNGEATDPRFSEIAIVWISYNVHGNESCTMEAGLKTIHRLAAAQDQSVKEILDNTIIIIDPCINPDGRDRYANFYSQFGNAVPMPDNQSMEHQEPWPGGRTNHYLFDLNRDWAWQSQTETQARMKVYSQWLPHVHADYHEQGINSPYYFAPAAEPYHEIVTDWQREFQFEVGRNTARNFDERAALYFTREEFDLLYPSYGDTYPSYHGAIGMTYEQGGSGSAGLLVTTKTGAELSLKERLENHYHSGMALLETASTQSARLCSEFEKYFERNRKSPWGKYKSYLIPAASNDAGKMEQLRRFLDLHHIEYGSASTKKSLNAWSYVSRKNAQVKAEQGDMVISAYQPYSSMLQVLFDPDPALSDSLTYDITTWALPYCFGLDAFALESDLTPSGEYTPPLTQTVDPRESPYAYLAAYSNSDNLRFLSAVLSSGIKVRVADTPFSMGDQHYPRGTLAILKADNPNYPGLGELLNQFALNTNTNLSVSYTGFSSTGYDLGSDHIRFVQAPSVAVLSGSQVSSHAFGEVWHLFEQEWSYPISVLNADYLSRFKLEKYNVIIVPSGWYSAFDEGLTADILHWVRDGGTLILMEDAIGSFANKNGFSISYYEDDEEEKARKEQKKDDRLTDRLSPYENRIRNSVREGAYGSIWEVNMDASHPLAFGYSGTYFNLKTNTTRYALLPNGWNVGYLSENAREISGFSGSRATRDQSNSLLFGVEDKGRGRIVYMVDNPLFRSFWENGKLLFGNAVFMVGAR